MFGRKCVYRRSKEEEKGGTERVVGRGIKKKVKRSDEYV